MKTIALIPARSGSTRIPRKNVAPLCGRPLIAYTIDAALASNCFDRVIVSTDDEHIAAIARAHGAETPFLRPRELSDGTPRNRTAAAEHALRWLHEYEGYDCDGLVLLQPTSPLRTADDIRGALELWQRTDADCCIAVTERHRHALDALELDATTSLLRHDYSCACDVCARDATRGDARSRGESGGTFYAAQGPLFCVRPYRFLTARSFWHGTVAGYVIPQSRALDIDTPWDLHVAELILRDQHVSAIECAMLGAPDDLVTSTDQPLHFAYRDGPENYSNRATEISQAVFVAHSVEALVAAQQSIAASLDQPAPIAFEPRAVVSSTMASAMRELGLEVF